MNCNQFLQRIHEFLDGELPPRDFSAFREHVENCQGCRQRHDEFQWVKQLPFQRLSPTLQRQLWKGVHNTRTQTWWNCSVHIQDSWRTLWRDLDRLMVWSRLAAVPLTLAFFAAIILQVEPFHLQQWTNPMVVTLSPASSSTTEATTTLVQVRYRGDELDDLMNTVWKMPFEDSLWLVAEVGPEGYAQIENVLEYPRSPTLLDAVDLTLRGSRFEIATSQHLDSPFLLYSFQKVDVYEDSRGL
ncbi:MAG: zf-HC2 domain-containing protein [Acidobacteriota bacterium]|nr:zf-HC2 domain-containing protein [Acidobacteriota bacterium]